MSYCCADIIHIMTETNTSEIIKDRKSTRLNSSHANIVCRLLFEKKKNNIIYSLLIYNIIISNQLFTTFTTYTHILLLERFNFIVTLFNCFKWLHHIYFTSTFFSP